MPRTTFYSLLKTVLIALLAALPGYTAWHPVGSLTASPPQGNQIDFHNTEAHVVITVLAPDLVRVRMVPAKVLPPDYSWAVIKTDWPTVAVEFSASESTSIIRTSELEVRVDLAPFRIAFYNRRGEADLERRSRHGVGWRTGPLLEVQCRRENSTMGWGRRQGRWPSAAILT